MILSPSGTARLRFAGQAAGPGLLHTDDPELIDLAYLGWDIARAATGLSEIERRALAALAAATLAAMRSGSTRVPIDARLDGVMSAVGGSSEVLQARALLRRVQRADVSDAVRTVIGCPGDRTPLILEGDWLYAERMRVLDERFCARVRERLARPVPTDAKAVNKALKGVADGPPPLTDEQKRAVKEALTSPLALITGGPGTGKTTIVVALLRALAWSGVPMSAVAVAAPTGKAAQRLQQAIDQGLASARRDMAEATLQTIAPTPQTMHRLLGFSPRSRRFARHENDPMPHRVIVVDEASMIDLAMMDRLLRALRPEARLVLLGDADQLPSIEAGAVFRDLCAALRVVRLTTNLRVERDEAAQRIAQAAVAINAGDLGGGFAKASPYVSRVDALTFSGPEVLAAPWAEVEGALLDRWWRERLNQQGALEGYASRTFHSEDGVFSGDDAVALRAMLELHVRSRLLCATRGAPDQHEGGGAEGINERLLSRLRDRGLRPFRRRGGELPAGTPVMVQRNDYERQLYNGDQGVVARVESDDAPAGLAAVFLRRDSLVAYPLDAGLDLAPAFAMTVHKAQGSEFDHVALVLPEADLPLMTRELVYTAMTRARRSVLIVGPLELLTRAVSRRIERYSGIAERLAETAR
jgi:exodeoxyribonuclease V alpha subunit